MYTYRRKFIQLSVVTAVSLLLDGCGERTIYSNTPNTLNVRLYPDDELVEYDARKIVLEFNEPMDAWTLDGAFSLRDKNGVLSHIESITIDPDDSFGQRVIIEIESDFYFKESWKYTVVVTQEARSASGGTLPENMALDFYTSSQSPFTSTETQRSKIIVISDLHINEQRGYDEKYSLFTQNGKLLVNFLEYVRTSVDTKELVILGDLMDMWVIPMAYETFHDSISDTESYFVSVSNAAVNKEIIDKINQIADEGKIRFSYVPGNHDMLFTETIFHKIFPSGVWKGVESGTGRYFPESSVVMEHGHNYDFYNAPDPVTTSGSLLPPGYFITRIYATGNLLSSDKMLIPEQLTEDLSSQLIYTTSWDIAVLAINISGFDPTLPQIYTNVDGYSGLYSSDEARDIYTPTVGSDWIDRQKKNGVKIPSSVIVGILNGSGKFFWYGSLEYSAIVQYFTQDTAMHTVVFGHTHHALLKQDFATLGKIYANSGTWVDKQYLNDGALTGTCIVLNTAASRGSDLENVTLYQAVSDDLGALVLKKIDEKYLDTTSLN